MSIRNPGHSSGHRQPGSDAAIQLDSGEHLVGRDSKCDIVIRDLTVSRRHAVIRVDPHQVAIRDLGSRNGTFVNDSPVQDAVVNPADVVRFGKVECRIGGCPAVLIRCTSENDESTAAQSVDSDSGGPFPAMELSPALRRVLTQLLEGRSEKQIASRLRRSFHTVHNEVREIYRQFRVNSRAELLALFVRRERKKEQD